MKLLKGLMIAFLSLILTACNSEDYHSKFRGTWNIDLSESVPGTKNDPIRFLTFSEFTETAVVEHIPTAISLGVQNRTLTVDFDRGVLDERVTVFLDFIRGKDNIIEEYPDRFSEDDIVYLTNMLSQRGYEFDDDNVFWAPDSELSDSVFILLEDENKLAVMSLGKEGSESSLYMFQRF